MIGKNQHNSTSSAVAMTRPITKAGCEIVNIKACRKAAFRLFGPTDQRGQR